MAYPQQQVQPMPPQPGGMPPQQQGMAQPAVMPPGQGGQMMPYPQNPSTPPSGQFDPFQNAPPQPVNPATPAPPLPGGGNSATAGDPGNWKGINPAEKNFYGGQQIAGADPNAADYGSVQNYADAAYENSQRYMAPQQEMQNARMAQDLINQGIDPNSPQGKQRLDMLAMQQGDQQNAAQFGAMQFGQGIQQQMAQQEQAKAGLAGQMQQGLWNQQLGASGQGLQKYLGNQQFELGKGQLALGNQAQQNQYNLGRSGQDLQRYGMDQSNQLGQGQLDLGRQGQNWNEMMGIEDRNMAQWQMNQNQQNWQDQFLYNMIQGQPAPGQSQVSPYGGMAQQNQGLFGQIAGPAGQFASAFTPSDRRLKKNISKAGQIDGINIYNYQYIWDDVDRIGVMAQEVPWASIEVGDYLAIDPRRVFA